MDWVSGVNYQSPKSQMSLEHPYGVSVSCKNLLPPAQSTSVLPSPIERRQYRQNLIPYETDQFYVHIAGW